MVGVEGLEPSRTCAHTLLKRARIPIPPHAHHLRLMAPRAPLWVCQNGAKRRFRQQWVMFVWVCLLEVVSQA